ncbi:MAG: aromatic ring-hydroxylating dioxygenase subunit alpha [Alphaproteobacteria bacterium]
MFNGFANVWTPLVLSRSVTTRPMAIELAGEPLVVFRGREGKIGVLIDQCPHRGVKLSLGQVAPDGCLQCAFHGWRFDTDGANRHVPLNPDAKRELLGARALPVRIVGDMVWVFTAVGAQPTVEPVAPEGLTAPGLARTYIIREWACHWTRAMENMLDSPHLPFVHRKTIGKPLLRRMTPETRMDVTWEDTAWGGRTSASMDGVNPGGFLEFYRPNLMALNIPIPKRHFRIHALVVPAGKDRTHLTVVASRDFMRSGLFEPIFRGSSAKIADEDKAVVESSPKGEVPPLGVEPSVATDRATLQFRKYYHETLRDSAA